MFGGYTGRIYMIAMKDLGTLCQCYGTNAQSSKADSKFTLSLWETSLQSNAVSHSLGATYNQLWSTMNHVPIS